MITIAKNEQYELEVNPEKNRAYLTIIGFWRNREQVSDYLPHWDEALQHLKPGFTLLTNATEMKVHPQEVKELHLKAQDKIINKGLKQVAEVFNDDIFSTAQLDKVAKDTAMPKKNFTSTEEAEAFLDRLP